MNPHIRTALLTLFLATLGGLLSNVVANYLPPLFEERRWLAIGLFILIVGLGALLDLYQRGLWSPWGDTVPGLDRAERTELLTILTPLMSRAEERRALLDLALHGHPLHHEVEFSGAARPFTINLLRQLANDPLALGVLLAVAQQQVGLEQQARLQALAAHMQRPVVTKPISLALKVGAAGLLVFLTTLLWYAAPWVGNVSAQRAVRCPPARICILVADFLPANNITAQTITRDIQQEITTVLNQAAPDHYILRTGIKVTDVESAQEWAREDGALLVVWGEVSETSQKLRIQFELVDLLDVSESRRVRAYRAQPLLYDPIGQQVECFNCFYADIAADTAQRTRLIAYTTAGLVNYVQGRPEEARVAFVAALACAGEPLDELVHAAVITALQAVCMPSVAQANWQPGLLYYYLGKSLVLQGNYALGIDALQRAAKDNEYDPAVWIGIGSAYQNWLAQPKVPLAIAALAQAASLSEALRKALPPSEWGAIAYNLGLTYELSGDFLQAETHYTAAVNRFGTDNVRAYISLVALGRVQRITDSDKARATLQQALTLDPSAPWAYLELAYLDTTDRSRALQHLRQVADQAPDEAYIAITKAELCEKWWRDNKQQDDFACVEAAYTQALTQRPDSGWLHSQIGEFYLPTNPVLPGQSWEQAVDHFQQAVALRPNDPWAHERLAYVLLNQQAYAEAIEQYEQTIALSYNGVAPAHIYCNLGIAQQRHSMMVEAQQSYQRCAELATTPEQADQAEQLLKAIAQ
ncbi:MAG: tetratricopeptide repeat protein [Caldilineaceae bacterium]